jgi:hypothetical protein
MAHLRKNMMESVDRKKGIVLPGGFECRWRHVGKWKQELADEEREFMPKSALRVSQTLYSRYEKAAKDRRRPTSSTITTRF